MPQPNLPKKTWEKSKIDEIYIKTIDFSDSQDSSIF